MFEDQMTTVAIGLALIIPGIFVVRWLLTRVSGSPDDLAEHHRVELEKRYRRGEIDEETYQRHLEQLRSE